MHTRIVHHHNTIMDWNSTILNHSNSEVNPLASGNVAHAHDTDADAPIKYNVAVAIILGIILSVLDLTTILGNLLVCVTILSRRSLRNTTNYFILSLSSSDLLLGIIVLPFSTINTLLKVRALSQQTKTHAKIISLVQWVSYTCPSEISLNWHSTINKFPFISCPIQITSMFSLPKIVKKIYLWCYFYQKSWLLPWMLIFFIPKKNEWPSNWCSKIGCFLAWSSLIQFHSQRPLVRSTPLSVRNPRSVAGLISFWIVNEC